MSEKIIIHNTQEQKDQQEKRSCEDFRKFRVLGSESVDFLRENNIEPSIDFDELSKYEDKAVSKHSQTLEQLNSRGGLDLHEVYALVLGKSIYDVRKLGLDSIAEELIKKNILHRM